MEENITTERKNDTIDIAAMWRKARKNWRLFAGSLFICIALVLCYLMMTKPVYQVSADVLINEETGDGDGLASIMAQSFSLDAMFSGGVVNDEMLIFSSHTLMRDVVKTLELNKTYKSKSGFLKKKSYYKNSPLVVDIPESVLDTLTKGVTVKIQVNKSGDRIKVQLKQGLFTTLLEQEASSFPVTLDYGPGVVIDTTSFYKRGEKLDFVAQIEGYESATEDMKERLYVGLADKKSNGIALAIEEANVQLGKDILNTLIACYDQDTEYKKNKKANNLLNFANARLAEVKQGLDEAERTLEEYKRENDLSDISSEAKIILEANQEYHKNLLEAETQYSIISMVDSFLNKPENKYSLVPITTGLPDRGAAEAINEYNKLLLERMRLLRSAKDSNLTLLSLTAQIDAMRENILNTVSKSKESLNIAREDLKRQEEAFQARLRGFPEQERAYLNLKRDQEIKSELYVFLMQRREESAMALSSTLPKCMVINSAYSSTKPVAPNALLLLLVALVAGLLLPVIYLYGKSVLSNKFNSKNALRRLTQLPVVGDIHHNAAGTSIVVSEGDTSAVAESFRLLRSNLQFALPNQGTGVLMVTSAEEGAGKSFVAVNLATAMAMMGRRTVLVDLNFRKPTLGSYIGISSTVGVADYLAIKADDEASLIHSTQLSSNLDVILAGKIKVNPSDLLLTDKLTQLIASLKAQYECVILDTASIERFADTFSLTRFTDATLFVCRANYTHQKCVRDVADFVAEGSLKNVLLVLNDTEEEEYIHSRVR